MRDIGTSRDPPAFAMPFQGPRRTLDMTLYPVYASLQKVFVRHSVQG